ncbi:pyridoxal-phosphate dependent enzyme [Streptomyces flavofungini]|uniref:pyridoxal-phosphate dependent enzyme n=1 Tax=Streptomyces flavofungini TaxID=68200 RepID=UPI0025AF4AB9|nr:pyridoxal-phosphate dependent enzyme [Streptomyces flavofungini]WJV47855.1 pyridoxal-phosphate dependent enzyme [Streptomyces flavofungini]
MTDTGSTTESRTTSPHTAAPGAPGAPPAWYARPAAREWSCAPAPADVGAFHATLPEYAPTPLTELPSLAAELGVGRVFVKDESARLGLPAFKALGASWAVHRVLAERASDAPVELVTATDGNHGRAVARIARQLGQRAHVFVSQGVHPGAAAAIEGEGARVTRVAGDYDRAVREAAAAARAQGSVLVQDMAWEGYEEVPARIVEGYSTLFAEVDGQLADAGADGLDLMAVPVGVGSLAQAAVTHYRSRGARGPALLAVEPTEAAPALASLVRGESVPVVAGETVMAGLNCGTLSGLAWPVLRAGLDAAVAVPDAEALAAVGDLRALGVSSGPCGAAALAGARAALTGAGARGRRAELGLGAGATVVLLSTEGTAANPHGAA